MDTIIYDIQAMKKAVAEAELLLEEIRQELRLAQGKPDGMSAGRQVDYPSAKAGDQMSDSSVRAQGRWRWDRELRELERVFRRYEILIFALAASASVYASAEKTALFIERGAVPTM